jgi:hypothetical protein
MKKIKSIKTQIEEIDNLMKDFNKEFGNIFKKLKRTNLKNFQNEIREYQDEWKQKFNIKLRNKNVNNPNFELLKFMDCPILNSDPKKKLPENDSDDENQHNFDGKKSFYLNNLKKNKQLQ